jgi:hypothetical protein
MARFLRVQELRIWFYRPRFSFFERVKIEKKRWSCLLLEPAFCWGSSSIRLVCIYQRQKNQGMLSLYVFADLVSALFVHPQIVTSWSFAFSHEFPHFSFFFSFLIFLLLSATSFQLFSSFLIGKQLLYLRCMAGSR